MKLKPSALVLLGLAMLLYAQSPSNGNITISGSTCATTNACVIAILPANAATATIDISGTYSGTLQFEGVGTTGTVASLSCTPIGTSTPATSTTSTGVWQCPVSGLAKAQVRGSSFSSGTAVVGINPSTAGAGAGKVVGGVSGLTPGTVPKAATATTLGDSVLSESSGNLTQSGSGVFNAPNLGFTAVTSPSTAVTVALASPATPGNVTNGAHSIISSWNTAAAYNTLTTQTYTNISAGAPVATVVDKTINGVIHVTALPCSADTRVNFINLWMTKAGTTTPYYLVPQSIANCASSADINTIDASLVTALPYPSAFSTNAGLNSTSCIRSSGTSTICVDESSDVFNLTPTDFLNSAGLYLVDSPTGGFVQLKSATSGGSTATFPAKSGIVAYTIDVPLVYNHSGTFQSAAHTVVDSCTLGTDCAVTLAGSAVFTSSSTYTCLVEDSTAIAATKVAYTSGSQFTITGTGTDVLRYVCTGW